MKRMILVLMTLAVAGWAGAAKGDDYVTYREYRYTLPPVSTHRYFIRQSAAPDIRSVAERMADATSDLYSMASAEEFSAESVYFDEFGNRVVSRVMSSDDRLTSEESQALQDLRELNIAAERFRQEAERERDPANDARPEYRRLIDAHQYASASIGRLQPSSAVFAQLRRVDRLMAELIDDMA